jgi:hypothetical protein
VKIQRCYAPPSFNVQHYELHHISDASVSGYGECSYLRASVHQVKSTVP